MVLSQLKMSNLACLGPGESIDTHIVGFSGEKLKKVILKIFVTLFAFIYIYKMNSFNYNSPNVSS